MKKLILKAVYGESFTHKKLPQLFLKLIRTELNKPSNIKMLTYIKDIYNISPKELNRLLVKNVSISNYADNVIIRFNNVKIRDLKSGEPLFLETLVDLINYGNREIKGLGVIDNITNYLSSHIYTLYKLALMRGGSNIWQ